MADITPGNSATFGSSKLEQQLYDSIHYWQNAERNSLEEEKFTSTKDDTFIMSGNFKLPGKLNYNQSTGLFSITAEPYLPTIPFSAGNPAGTIKGATFSQYFLDLVQYIVLWQMNKDKNPNSQFNVSLNYIYGSNEFNGEFSIPYTVGFQPGGGIIETATPWLLT
jgi:hypothetical protein